MGTAYCGCVDQQYKAEIQVVNSARPDKIRFLGIQDLLDVFDDFRPHAVFVRLALKSGSTLPDAADSIVEKILETNQKLDKATTNKYVMENLEIANSLLARTTETALDHMLTRIDAWQFDKTGRVDAAPELERNLQRITIPQGEMAVVQQMAFCLRPPKLHNYAEVFGISDSLFNGRLSGHSDPIAIVTVGAPGSGKDYMIMHSPNSCLDYLNEKHGHAKDQYVVLDPDVWITQLCDNVNEHRDLANFLNLEHFFYAINRRSNLIFNATGKDIKNTAGRVISRLKAAKYKVYICVVLAKFSVVMERIAERKRKTGRDVPEPVVKSIFKGLQEAVPLYMKNQAKMADGLLVYSNNGDGTDSRSGPSFTLTSGVDPQKAIDFANSMLHVPG